MILELIFGYLIVKAVSKDIDNFSQDCESMFDEIEELREEVEELRSNKKNK